MKTKEDFKVGQRVTYTNGSPTIYNGEIVQITDRSLVVINCAAGMQLWNAGCRNGDEIAFSQVKE